LPTCNTLDGVPVRVAPLWSALEADKAAALERNREAIRRMMG
jgi:hypothetical protein